MSSTQEQQLPNAFGKLESDDDTILVQTVTRTTTTSTYYVSGEPTTGEPQVDPLSPETIGGEDYVGVPRPVTIGQALERVAENIGDKPVTASDARATQCAEGRATGIPSGVKGGPAAEALSAVDSGVNEDCDPLVTVGDVLAVRIPHLYLKAGSGWSR